MRSHCFCYLVVSFHVSNVWAEVVSTRLLMTYRDKKLAQCLLFNCGEVYKIAVKLIDKR